MDERQAIECAQKEVKEKMYLDKRNVIKKEWKVKKEGKEHIQIDRKKQKERQGGRRKGTETECKVKRHKERNGDLRKGIETEEKEWRQKKRIGDGMKGTETGGEAWRQKKSMEKEEKDGDRWKGNEIDGKVWRQKERCSEKVTKCVALR